MNKKRFLVSTITALLGVFIFFTSQANAAPQSKRLGGIDRYATCSEIVNDGWKTSKYAVVVNGENFPDALSASVLAKKYNAPILLTPATYLDRNAIEQLRRLSVKNVFIIGGKDVINDCVEQDIKWMGIQTTRLSGQDRNETSIKVAEQVGTNNGIVITIDDNFTDALSVAPMASKLQMPIILVPKSVLPQSVKNFVSGKNISKTYVLGDNDIISGNVASNFPNTMRITGSNECERNINIINAFMDKVDFSNVCLAYSVDFADALSGSAYAAINCNPIILVGYTPSTKTINFMKSKLNSINGVTVLGGTAGISDNELATVLNGNSNGSQTSKVNPSSNKNSDNQTTQSQTTKNQTVQNQITYDQAVQSIKNILEKPGPTERIYSNPKIKSINGKSYYEILSETVTFHSPFDCLVDAQSGDVYVIDDYDNSHSQYIPNDLDLNSVKLILIKDWFIKSQNLEREISSDEAMNILKSKVSLPSYQWLEYEKEEVFNEPGIVPEGLKGQDCYVIDSLSLPDICDGTYYVCKQGGDIYFDCQGQWKIMNWCK